jgi:hypothetical protein
MRFYIVLGLTIEKYCQRNKLESMFFVVLTEHSLPLPAKHAPRVKFPASGKY